MPIKVGFLLSMQCFSFSIHRVTSVCVVSPGKRCSGEALNNLHKFLIFGSSSILELSKRSSNNTDKRGANRLVF